MDGLCERGCVVRGQCCFDDPINLAAFSTAQWNFVYVYEYNKDNSCFLWTIKAVVPCVHNWGAWCASGHRWRSETGVVSDSLTSLKMTRTRTQGHLTPCQHLDSLPSSRLLISQQELAGRLLDIDIKSGVQSVDYCGSLDESHVLLGKVKIVDGMLIIRP